MDKEDLMRVTNQQLLKELEKSELPEYEIIYRYLIEEYMEMICDSLYTNKLFDVSLKLYTDFNEFSKNELCFTDCLTSSRVVKRNILDYIGIESDDAGNSVCDGITRHNIIGSKKELNVIIYTSIDSLVFNFYEEVIVFYIPKTFVMDILRTEEKFYKVVG